MCIDATTDTGRTERLRQHAREFKHEQAVSDVHPGRWLSDGELAKLASSGAIQGRRTGPRMSRAMSAIVAAMWLGSIAASLTVLYFAAHAIFNLFVRLAPHL